MKNKNIVYYLGLLVMSFNACYTGIPKSNTIRSWSKTESVNNKVYVGDYEVVYLKGASKFENLNSFDCWSEFAATTENDFFFFPKRKKLDFQNFFLKINDKTCNSGYDVTYKTTVGGLWEITSCIQEPNLGFYFQINQDIKVDSIRIKLKTSRDSCVYFLKKI